MPRLWTNGLLVLLGLCYLHRPVAIAAEVHHGLYSHRIGDGQLVVPRKVNHLGEHISHDLTHHWSDEEEEIGLLGLANKRRRRRSVGDPAADALHYQLELNNETLHIELEPSHDSFIAPMMVVERHRRDTRSRKNYQQTHENKLRKLNGTVCHYQGKIRNHPNSKVAMSACNGLAGYMATKDGFYWVEPSKKHRYHPELGHPHVVFQGQNEIPSATKLPKKYQKNRKHQNQRRKRRISTCGTREPKQSTETRIEWQKQGKVMVQGGRKTRHRGGGGQHKHKNEKQQQREEQQRRKRKRSRPKRSVSTPHHVEALLVADVSMSQFHQEVETYLLTIMNMVSSLYKDPTIGNLVQVTVVRIVVLEDEGGSEEEGDEEQLEVTHQAERTLSNFCRWQRNLNPKTDSDPTHHDVAILITRKDICSTAGCMTLGVANVGGMCRPDRSCSVNEDNGITLAHTITHELGHNFGMIHDIEEKTGCGHRIGPTLHVMTPSFESDTTHVSWSNCSRRDITHFLDQGHGSCLDDVPTAKPIPYDYDDMPPGAMYKAEDQCRFQFNSTDEKVKVCSRANEICSMLWCTINDECQTQLKAAAPGTRCGYHRWCHERECVEVDQLPKPVHGGWGNWTEWSECSRTCGSGVSIQSRVCDNPPPANGGTFCIGDRTHYKTCNTDPCPVEEPSFRAVQCTRYNNETFRGNNYTWLPYFDTQEPCKLFCTDTDDTVIVPWGNGAIDGTPCNIGTNDLCINGICKKVGCDWIVDSNTTEDQCGICGGNGDTCEVVKGDFNKKLNITEGYYPIVTIPEGSRNIHVEEINGSAKNFLSIGKANSKTFYLNGERTIYLSGEYNLAGTLGLYERNNDRETLRIPGPIKEDIILYVLMKGNKHKNVGLKFEYTLSSNSTLEPVYGWKLGDWTACSATCGGGVQHRFPICYQDYKGIVDEDLCWANAQNDRPTQKQRSCNELECPYYWYKGPWQMCTLPNACKKRGEPEPTKLRTVLCVDQDSNAVNESNCKELDRPDMTEPCNQIFPYCESEEQTDVDKKVLQNKL